MTDNSNPPDSWDQQDTGGLNSDFSKLSMNANANVFVPGQNVHAFSFVPTFAQKASVDTTAPAPAPITEAACAALPTETPDTWEGGTDAEELSETPEPPADALEKLDNAGVNGGSDGDEEETEEEASDETEEEQVTKKKPPKKKPVPAFVEEEAGPKKQHVNVVFIGHVDAGKSTIGGHLMYLTGMVEKRTLEKYEREAKEKNRETWYLSWALDTNLEEREKGKTVEVGRAFFETDNKHFTILDAPGHKSFVPNMISGAAQADLAVLVISARRGEFETGFERGGQTREHAMLVKTAGVKYLIVLINKMDDSTVNWDLNRYTECKEKLSPFLKKVGFNLKTEVYFMPCSGFTGAFLKESPGASTCPWYSGPCFIKYLEDMPSFDRRVDAPVRMPIVDKYKDMGTIVLGKLETGTIAKGQTLSLMPNKVSVEVMMIWSDDNETNEAVPGENIKLKLKNIEDDEVLPGFVLCSPYDLCHVGEVFDAHVVILDHKSIICAGYTAVMHLHTCSEEVTVTGFHWLVDRKTGEKTQKRPRFVKQDQMVIARFKANGGRTCMEAFKNYPQLGRFTLRDEGRTVAIGKILKVVD